jgi:hypothetical protein
MPVPSFTEEGVLPEGVHDCTLDELRQTLGGTNQRRRLVGHLRDYTLRLHSAWGRVRVIVDGSFITSKEAPNDVDIIVLVNELGLTRAPGPLQSSTIDRKYVNLWYSEEIDLKVAYTDAEADKWSDFFAQVKAATDKRKGLLRVTTGATP